MERILNICSPRKPARSIADKPEHEASASKLRQSPGSLKDLRENASAAAAGGEDARKACKSVRASMDGSVAGEGVAGLRRSVSNMSGVSKRAFKF
jgi:hypothetical protein